MPMTLSGMEPKNGDCKCEICGPYCCVDEDSVFRDIRSGEVSKKFLELLDPEHKDTVYFETSAAVCRPSLTSLKPRVFSQCGFLL